MMRSFCWLGLLGVAVVPDWAAAFQPCWCPPPPCYVVPVCPPPVYVVPCVPVYNAPVLLAPPKVYVTPQVAPVTRVQPTPVRSANPTPANVATPAPPKVTVVPNPMPAEVVRPAAATSPAPPPTIIPEPRQPDKPVANAPTDEPKKPDMPTSGLPPLPPLPAVPTAAPADSLPPLIPPPAIPEKADKKTPEALPPLVLPPDLPAIPSPAPAPMSTSKSSPLTGRGIRVAVYPAAGAAVGPTRKVGFFNHTGADIELVVEGKAVTLPRMTYIHAELPPTFRWKHGSGATETATVPADAAGLEVVFRE